jgi:hypothetical protein
VSLNFSSDAPPAKKSRKSERSAASVTPSVVSCSTTAAGAAGATFTIPDLLMGIGDKRAVNGVQSSSKTEPPTQILEL